MKIGILTFHRAHNYGAVLQCYALQEVLKGMGHDVWVIDYRQPYIENIYSVLWYRKLVHYNPINTLKYLKGTYIRIIRRKIFKSFQDQFFRLTNPVKSKYEMPSDFDYYYIGSDQLWGLECLGGKVDRIYFGDFNGGKGRKIGYAISGSLNSFDKIGARLLTQSISNFSQISFREKKLCDKIKDLCGIQAETAIDPTLLADASIWNPLINNEWKSKGKFVVLYEVRNASRDKDILKRKAESYAKSKGYELVILSNTNFSVCDFISAIKYGQLIITSSFHATVFSIIFKRYFCTYCLQDGNDTRYTNLLDELSLKSALFNLNENPKEIDYDFNKAELKLAELREEMFKKYFSMNY
ncbi:MAG: polysaccharide pyruvyl transferase family protein [Paludibacteraceae bacterium]|nr:polysaccharide pyruvyl transferase family protein [Paludibacteraceae bacterium]